MEITEKLVEHVADLAQMQLDDAQKVLMCGELSKILGYIDALNTVDTAGVEPISHLFPVTNVMRPDIRTESSDRAALFRNAPEHTEEVFVVPRTVG